MVLHTALLHIHVLGNYEVHVHRTDMYVAILFFSSQEIAVATQYTHVIYILYISLSTASIYHINDLSLACSLSCITSTVCYLNLHTKGTVLDPESSIGAFYSSSSGTAHEYKG